ncbi:hypothetical protein OIV83_005245 [Microbotryomycetes sp. JL201]|nr:hypothetical protein OIV83_005245 [Microbotryomycetes sp. JL201]
MTMEKKDGFHVEEVDLNHNLSGKIQNPLHGLSREELFARVDAFCNGNGLEGERELFRRGAMVAQAPGDFEELTELSEDEKYHIRREITNRWSQPWSLYFTVFICSLAACVQGWDQTGTNGANLTLVNDLELAPVEGDQHETERREWLLGLINAAPYAASALIGCWLSDPVNSVLGRRGTIFCSAVFCIFPVIGQGLCQTWYQLFVCRVLLGIGMGLKASITSVFAAENCPALIRGGLVMSWQLWTAFGIFLGTAANLILADTGRIAWRLEVSERTPIKIAPADLKPEKIASAFIPAVPLALFIYMCPESPRWLMKKKRYPQAWRSFLRLRNSPIQAARDMFYVHAQLEIESVFMDQGNFFTRFFELWTKPRVRRATIAASTVMIGQQMCGINIIAFYSSSIFAEAGYSNKQALGASLGFGAINFLFAFPAVWTIDTFGRRNLLLFTFPNMAWTLLVSGLMFLLPESSGARLPLILLFIYLFCIFYSPGEGPVPYTYSAEVFPLSHREVGMSWAVATTLFWASILGITFPRMISAMTPTGAFGFYAALNVTAFWMIFFLCPETKQRTLEELDYVFAVPVGRHASYQARESLPYFLKRWVRFDKTATLRPLYDFDEVSKDVHQTHAHERKLDDM